MDVCPLVFQPIFKPKVWGGRNLARLLDKALPGGEPIGESWECADLEAGQSVVARGSMRGKTLHEVVERWGPALLGRAALVDGRFPLLIKFLDAVQDLSIQVHPDPETARRLGGDVRIKHEAWHILEARGDAAIYRGLRPGVTVDALAAALAETPAAIVDFVERVPVKPGQTYFLPSGTLHALGAGVVVAEVQTPSDITYRLYDWGRVRPDSDAGLHVEQGLACIIPDLDPKEFEKRSHVAGTFTTVTRLVECPSFRIEKVRFVSGVEQDIPYAELVCWIILEGAGEIVFGGAGAAAGRETFRRGDTLILPAGIRDARLHTHSECAWLEVTIPAPSDLAGRPRIPHGRPESSARPGAPVPLNIDIGKS